MRNYMSMVFVLCVCLILAGAVEAKNVTAVSSIVLRNSGYNVMALGYDDGSIELRNWAGGLLGSRTGLGRITALDSYRTKNSYFPRMFIASAENGGTIRMVDPAVLGTDLAKRVNIGTITTLNTWDHWIYAGVKTSTGGKLFRLDNLTFATLATRNFGEIKAIRDIESNGYDDIAIASTDGGGYVRRIDGETLATIVGKASFGTIYDLEADDVDWNDSDELFVASSVGGGTVKVLSGDNLSTITSLTGLGTISSVAGSCIGFAQNDGAGNGKYSVAVALSNGYIKMYHVSESTGVFALAAQKSGYGRVVDMGAEDVYDTDFDMLAILNAVGTNVNYHVTNELLTDTTKFSVFP